MTPGEVTIGLDLARKSGVTVGVPFGIPATTSWVLEADTRGGRALQFARKLGPVLDHWKPLCVGIEEPLEAHVLAQIGSTIDTQIQLNGLVYVAEMMCEARGIPTMLLKRQDVLGHFTGQKRYKVKDDGKRACFLRCNQLKYPVNDWDQADAAALWDYLNALRNPKSYALAGVQQAAKFRK